MERQRAEKEAARKEAELQREAEAKEAIRVAFEENKRRMAELEEQAKHKKREAKVMGWLCIEVLCMPPPPHTHTFSACVVSLLLSGAFSRSHQLKAKEIEEKREALRQQTEAIAEDQRKRAEEVPCLYPPLLRACVCLCALVLVCACACVCLCLCACVCVRARGRMAVSPPKLPLSLRVCVFVGLALWCRLPGPWLRRMLSGSEPRRRSERR